MARETSSKTTIAPAPKEAHCQAAKVGSVAIAQLQIGAPTGHPQLGDTRRAVHTPIPIPTGTDAKRSTIVEMRLTN